MEKYEIPFQPLEDIPLLAFRIPSTLNVLRA
jgi:hypothetical protein